MYTYTYMFRFVRCTETFDDLEDALHRAIFDYDDNTANPVSITDETGSVVYDRDTIVQKAHELLRYS